MSTCGLAQVCGCELETPHRDGSLLVEIASPEEGACLSSPSAVPEVQVSCIHSPPPHATLNQYRGIMYWLLYEVVALNVQYQM